ncbi:P-loop NTPase fold protein [Promicromonospora sp. NPDC060204]|uniref:P-loop NTPase fold protein n=1 Tax=Promicromonospora sp. NPDC060204 TaxID=3347071 RepID=UPI003660CC76
MTSEAVIASDVTPLARMPTRLSISCLFWVVCSRIRTRFKATGRPEESDDDQQDPATLYLHKIVQTTIPLPALSHFDTQAYLLLLQLEATATAPQLATLIGRCAQVRREGGSVDDIGVIAGLAMDDELAFATRLTPLLYEKLGGNPRYIKRFLNDLHVRQSVASRRGISLDAAVVAKLMTLEALMKPEFKLLLGWFAKGEMRDQLGRLEDEAGRPAPVETPVEGHDRSSDAAGADTEPMERGRRAARATSSTTDAVAVSGQFSQAMVRWAKLAPSLRGLDLSPYLTLAATFAGITLIDDSLPERLRDIAANLLSESTRQRASVTDDELEKLGTSDATDLLRHIGRTMRDQPAGTAARIGDRLTCHLSVQQSRSCSGSEWGTGVTREEAFEGTTCPFRACSPRDGLGGIGQRARIVNDTGLVI